MTSIAAAGAAGYLSPRDRLQNELTSEVSSGSISSTDQSALSSALDDIDQSLKTDRTSNSQASGPPSPDQMKSKITDLINGEVQNGTLTSAQATELQNVFSNAFAKGGPGGGGGPGGPGGAGGASGHHGGHHHGGGAGGATDSDSSSSAADALLSAINSNSSDGSSSADGTDSLIQTFLQSLKDSQQQGTGYTANGDSGSSSSNALVVDFTS